MKLTNKPFKSKINLVNILVILAALFGMPELQSVVDPKWLLAGSGIITVLLRTFFNGQK